MAVFDLACVYRAVRYVIYDGRATVRKIKAPGQILWSWGGEENRDSHHDMFIAAFYRLESSFKASVSESFICIK
jgi:hypothetical protein